MHVLFPLIAIAAGVAAAVQAAANAGLARHVGFGAALVVNTVIVLAGTLVVWGYDGAPRSFFPAGTPLASYLGGLCGLLIVVAGALVFPKIGAAYAIAFMVFGQCLAALVIDHFGLLGMPAELVTAKRALGVALVGFGIAVLKW